MPYLSAVQAALSVTLSISNRDDAEGISTVTKRGMPLTALQASWLLPPSARDGGGGTGEAAVVGCMFAAPGFRTDAHQQVGEEEWGWPWG